MFSAWRSVVVANISSSLQGILYMMYPVLILKLYDACFNLYFY